ncbi:MAG: hypothetical protein JY451_05015 [Erythrobacter sp.]|nr:MAG: hypothetical protein JY451_05015 [Erythrobacter sp.]
MNETDFNDQKHRTDVAKGIVAPQPTSLQAGTRLYRFGDTFEKAKSGTWWISAKQFAIIDGYASEKGIPSTHAARLLASVLHSYSTMRVMVSVRLLTDLRAWTGLSRPQQRTYEGHVLETIDTTQTFAGSKFHQLYVPGLELNSQSFRWLSDKVQITMYMEGDSHIFGTSGVPAGTIMH